MNKKKLILIGSLFIILFATAYLLRPKPLSSLMSDAGAASLQIVRMEGTRDFSKGPDLKTYKYNIQNDSYEHKAICELLKKYSYHISINTITKNTSSVGGRDLVYIKSNKHTIMLTGNDKILIDDIPYRVGHWGKTKGKALTKDFIVILKNH